jgi:prepilin-type N-terminal cleavage/methylation domain-containing protein
MSSRHRRRTERGFTLVELLVAIGLMTLVMAALMAGFQVGIKALGTGGAPDRAAGAHDLSSFEQQLSMDVTRASCISVGSSAYGACAHSVAPGGTVIASCSSAVLCVAWPQYSGNANPGISAIGCLFDAYTQPGGSGKKVVRTEYVVMQGTAQSLARVNVTTADGVQSLAPTVTSTSTSSGVVWVSSIQMTVTATGVKGGSTRPSGTLQMRPLTVDPGAQQETVQC